MLRLYAPSSAVAPGEQRESWGLLAGGLAVDPRRLLRTSGSRVKPGMTVADVARLCAKRFRHSRPAQGLRADLESSASVRAKASSSFQLEEAALAREMMSGNCVFMA